MFILLEWNRFALAANVDFEPCRAGGDRQVLVAELADHVKGFARRLVEREPQLVLRNRTLDFSAHVSGRLEESVCGHETVEGLMRTLEVVMADVVLEPPLRVDDVREDRAAEKFVPQRLPETLDLAERLRMLRPTADVLDSESFEVLLEFGLAAPHGVLPTVVGQHFCRCTVRRYTALESLHHERGLLVVRE
jgi:hypothetical protein